MIFKEINPFETARILEQIDGFLGNKPFECMCGLKVQRRILLFPHISPISRTRGHRRRLPFPYHRYIQKTQTKEEKERKKIYQSFGD